jgi:multiple antibiotic resistance protein
MNFNLKEIGEATMVLFAVIDIIGSIPLIISIKQKAGTIHPLRATLVALGIMVGFLFLGQKILSYLHVGVNEFAVAGSFIIFFMALEMILGIKLFKDDEQSSSPKVASVVPLAFPIIAGAGTMTSIISLRAAFADGSILIGILINIVIVFLVLKLTKRIESVLGDTGIAIMQKVFGVILLSIAVKLFSENVQALIH